MSLDPTEQTTTTSTEAQGQNSPADAKTPAPAADAKTKTKAPKEPKAPRAPTLTLTDESTGEVRPAVKYPMPLKAGRFNLKVNGTEVEAATTSFGTIRYTYFEFNGSSFYVKGVVDANVGYKFSYPDTYKFEAPAPLKQAAKKAKKATEPKAEAGATAPAATAGEPAAPEGAGSESNRAAAPTSAPAEGTLPGAAAEAATGPKSARKAKR
jgi:hypothetical protein